MPVLHGQTANYYEDVYTMVSDNKESYDVKLGNKDFKFQKCDVLKSTHLSGDQYAIIIPLSLAQDFGIYN